MNVQLDRVRIASPCNARWEDMTGTDRARFCAHCSQNVYNFSAMTRADADALNQEKEVKLCGRVCQRADGHVLTTDCPSGQRRRRNALARCFGACSALVMFCVTSCSHRRDSQGQPVMGIV